MSDYPGRKYPPVQKAEEPVEDKGAAKRALDKQVIGTFIPAGCSCDSCSKESGCDCSCHVRNVLLKK
jgi:hypothetical protein